MKRVYKQKLNRAFLLISILLGTIISISFWGILVSMYSSDTILQLQPFVYTQTNSNEISGNIMQNAVSELAQSDGVDLWANAEKGSKYYYYYAININQHLGRLNVNSFGVNFNLAVTDLSDDSMIIDGEGTSEKSNYFTETYSNLTYDDWQLATAHLKAGEETFFLPIYENGELTEIYMFINNFSNNEGLVCILSASVEVFLAEGNDMPYCIISTDGEKITYGQMDKKYITTIDKTISQLDFDDDIATLDEASIVMAGSDIAVLLKNKFPSFYIIYTSPFSNFFTLQRVILLFAVPMVMLIAFILPGYLLSERLYKPVSDVISQYMDDDEEDEGVDANIKNVVIDEFDIIRKKSQNMNSLSKELDIVRDKQKFIVRRAYYRELLFGIPNSDCPLTAEEMSSSYRVLLVEYNTIPADTEQRKDLFLYLQKQIVETEILELSSDTEVIFYINLSGSIDVIVFMENDYTAVKAAINRLLSNDELVIDLMIALSERQDTVMQIHEGYSQARQILEYRYVLPKNAVLTMADLEGKNNDCYYFPIDIQNRLISEIAIGSMHALKIYDRIMQQNSFGKNLSSEMRQNFVFVIVSTIVRVFQELKTTPEELIGIPIDTHQLIAMSDSSAVWAKIRFTINQILEALNCDPKIKSDDIFDKIQEYIKLHFAEDIMLGDMAKFLGLTPTYCSSLFKQLSGGTTFKTYLNDYRVKIACEMLAHNQELKIVELYNQVGFNSANSFIRAFSKKMNMTPKAYAESFATYKNTNI